MQIRARKISSIQVRFLEIRINAFRFCFCEISPMQVCLYKAGSIQARSTKIRTLELCLCEFSLIQVCLYKVGFLQARFPEPSPIQPASLQIDPPALEGYMFLYEHQGQQALNFF